MGILRQIRLKREMTQEDLAKAASISVAQIQRLEADDSRLANMALSRAYDLAEALQVSVGELITKSGIQGARENEAIYVLIPSVAQENQRCNDSYTLDLIVREKGTQEEKKLFKLFLTYWLSDNQSTLRAMFTGLAQDYLRHENKEFGGEAEYLNAPHLDNGYWLNDDKMYVFDTVGTPDDIRNTYEPMRAFRARIVVKAKKWQVT